MKLVYFVHDLADAAVHRRVRMLSNTAEIRVLGFRRSAEPVPFIAGWPTVDLGQTFNAKLTRRVGSVLHAALTVPRWRQHVIGADVIIARQLEMLTLAALGRRVAAPKAKLIYECLDIHRMMLGQGKANEALRTLERKLLKNANLLAISSPAFLSEYFNKIQAINPPSLVIENKVLATEIGTLPKYSVGPVGPPWCIGWFGAIRCRRSLMLLSALCEALPGVVEVVIRGRVSYDVVSDFDEVVEATPGMSFHGPYDRHTDLESIYGAVHFNWTMDFFESPGNSEWLLPNRLYEGSLYGAVPIALASVETGRWLHRHKCGLLLNELPSDSQSLLESSLVQTFARMDQPRYQNARREVDGIPRDDLVADDDGLSAHLTQ